MSKRYRRPEGEWNVVIRPHGKPVVAAAGWASSIEDLFERRDWIQPDQTDAEKGACYQRRLDALKREAEEGVALYQPIQLAADLFGFRVSRQTVAQWVAGSGIRLPCVSTGKRGARRLTTIRAFCEWLAIKPIHTIRNQIRQQHKKLEGNQ